MRKAGGNKGEEPWDNELEIDMNGKNVTIEYDKDYYEGTINVDGEDYTWDYRRTGAASLITSGATIVSIATTLF